MKNSNEVILKLSSNLVFDSNDVNNFQHNLSLTNRLILRYCKAFANGLSVHIKLSKTQWQKIRQSGGFLGRLSGPFLNTGLSLKLDCMCLNR